ncbi:calcineurin-like phosphoesterase [Hypoxylon trugodes]|uniref:calcineurin-like phosphoesterase n=1 Tax=Hypoxylon trugodes TaxID=326681 RepID=UPI00219E4182|nr:calcineurin-like phosphoesterase [Hypoxylon trugodes]KAI1390899.1 calcineurin-like phosphoesterase [Hypoxylon trugodes]
MTRRIVRTASQLAAAAVFAFFIIFLLDRNFRLLPNAVHEYMPQHHHGSIVTDITITQCSKINLFSSCKLDPERWHRVEKNLYLEKSWVSSAYVHVQRKKEEELTSDDKVVIGVTVGRLDPSTGVKGQADEKWESRPAGLWVLRSSKPTASDSKKAVTAVDVLFGDDAVEARDGWQFQNTPLLLDAGSDIPTAHITVRQGSQAEPVKPQPRIKDNGKFKIMQLADLHLSTGVGHCRDAVPDEYEGGACLADLRTLDFVSKLLDEEKPDLVVLSGDQVNGDTAPDAQSAIFKYAQLLIKHKVPYVSIFGNHDDEGSLPRAGQMALIEQLPYSLSVAGPDDIDGVGNYYIEILAQGTSKHSALTVYLLDSHSYSPDERQFSGYDWIKKNQIDWFKQTSDSLKKKHKEYTHIHMDIAFIHIPLPEYTDAESIRVGELREGVTAPKYNSGFRDALVEQGVVMVSCGHDHANEYCMLSANEETKKPELWMCYAGGSGFGGYGGYGGYVRRIRFFDIDMNEARITTYKRLEYGDTASQIDKQIIVDGGSVIAPKEYS